MRISVYSKLAILFFGLSASFVAFADMVMQKHESAFEKNYSSSYFESLKQSHEQKTRL